MTISLTLDDLFDFLDWPLTSQELASKRQEHTAKKQEFELKKQEFDLPIFSQIVPGWPNLGRGASEGLK